MNTSTPDTARPPGAVEPVGFIRQMIARDLASGKHGGRVHTRFPPEPNGYLHIGHAKSICLNFSLAEEHGGRCNLRFDDTNPLKESQEFVDAIKDNIRWLGFRWHGEVRYSSSYFEQLYEFARQLIGKGRAYVCALGPDEARQYRGSLTEAGRNSPWRERDRMESLELFARMRAGEFADGELSLRAKIDMSAPNMNLRDPILYRIRHADHHQTGSDWCIYPTYDYTHCISDAIEHITHSLCTLEFEDHRPLYDWILHSLDIESLAAGADADADADADSGPRHGDTPYVLPEQTEFAKLRISYTMLGKRFLRALVEAGQVDGWDDPRMPTLAGMRRRGYTPASIRNFCEAVGVARSESLVDIGMLEHAVREDLDHNAPRAMCVQRPLKVVLRNFDEGRVGKLQLPRHPKREELGHREVTISREICIEREDFSEDPPPGFRRLVPGGEVRLRGAYVIRCDEVLHDDAGEVRELHCSVDFATLGRRPEGRKVKGVIHWVSRAEAKPVILRYYGPLFTQESPAPKSIEEVMDGFNSKSFFERKTCLLEPGALGEGAGDHFQFERVGYFHRDHKAGNGIPVFNRTTSLRGVLYVDEDNPPVIIGIGKGRIDVTNKQADSPKVSNSSTS